VDALDVAEARAAGAAEETGVSGGVYDHVEALVGVEAEEDVHGGVVEDSDVGVVDGKGAAGRVGSCDAEGEAADGGRDVVAESVAGGGGFEGGGGHLGVTAEPRVPDDVAWGVDVGDGGGDVGLGCGVDGGDGLDGEEPEVIAVDRVGLGQDVDGGGWEGRGRAWEKEGCGRRGGKKGAARAAGLAGRRDE